MSAPTPNAKRFQFSLRTAIALSVVAGLLIWAGLGFYRWKYCFEITVANHSGEPVAVYFRKPPSGGVLFQQILRDGETLTYSHPQNNTIIDVIWLPYNTDYCLDLIASGPACLVSIGPGTKFEVTPREYAVLIPDTAK